MNGKSAVVNNNTNNNKKKPFIVVVAGPSGTGKTTIGNFLSSELNSLSSQYNISSSTFIEGDDFHSKKNIEKMKNNIPLDDNDRWTWLKTLCKESFIRLNQLKTKENENNNKNEIIIISCSALKVSYRKFIYSQLKQLFQNNDNDKNFGLLFVFLSPKNQTLLQQRIDLRSQTTNHYMPSTMVSSQLQIMQVPSPSESLDYYTLPIAITPQSSTQSITTQILEYLNGLLLE